MQILAKPLPPLGGGAARPLQWAGQQALLFVCNPVVYFGLTLWLIAVLVSVIANFYWGGEFINMLGNQLPPPTQWILNLRDLFFGNPGTVLLAVLLVSHGVGRWLMRSSRPWRITWGGIVLVYVGWILFFGLFTISMYLPLFYIPKLIR
jgi:hypothetical protein